MHEYMIPDAVDGIVDFGRRPFYPEYMKCAACHRTVSLRKDGKVKAHRRDSLAGRYGYGAKRIRCEGSGKEPLDERSS